MAPGHRPATRSARVRSHQPGWAVLAALAPLTLAATPAFAATAIFDYGGLVPGYGAVPGSGNPASSPWARVTLQDTAPKTVSLLVENLVPAPYGDTLTALVFNLTSSTPLALSATCSVGGTAYVSQFQGAACGTLSQGTDDRGLQGGGQATQRFDLSLDLLRRGNSPRQALNGGETMTFILTTLEGTFTVESLLGTNPPFRNQSGTGGYQTFAKFQSVGNGSGSVEVYGTERPNVSRSSAAPREEVAVPGPLPLLGVAAAFGWTRRLRRQLKTSSLR